MRTSAVIVCAVLASCGGPSGGVELVVTPGDDSVTRIALFVGKGDPMKVNIGPENVLSPYMDTEAWVRDPNNELSQIDNVHGDAVTFGLIGPSDPLSMIIAVGYDTHGNITTVGVLPEQYRPVEVPAHAVARFDLPLQAVSSIDSMSPLEVHVWKPTDPNAPGDPSSCVLVLDKPSGTKVAIVSDDDQDCDGWPATNDPKECVRSMFMSGRLPRLDSTMHCSAPTTYTAGSTGSTINGAVLGGDVCQDGMGIVPGCKPSNYCLPRSAHDACNGDFSCLQDTTLSSNATAAMQMHCFVQSDANGQLCQDPIKAFNDSRVRAWSPICKAGSGVAHISAVGQPWGNSVTFTPDPQSSPITVGVSDVTSDCTFYITPSGHWAADNAFGHALVAVDLMNGHGVAMSYTFSGTGQPGTCGTPTDCYLVTQIGLDGLVECAASPLVTP